MIWEFLTFPPTIFFFIVFTVSIVIIFGGKAGLFLANMVLVPVRFVGWTYYKIPEISFGKPFGIPFKISRAWILFYGYITFLAGWSTGAEIALAFVFVTIHEFCHSIAAKKFGHDVESITLYPFSGLASIKGNWNENADQEFWITVVGPLSNIVLAFLFLPAAFYWPNDWTLWLVDLNFILVMFNIIPIYPMDGGRIAHAICLKITNNCDSAASYSKLVSGVASIAAVPIVFKWNPIAAILLAFMFFGGLIEHKAAKEMKKKREKDLAEVQLLEENARTQLGVALASGNSSDRVFWTTKLCECQDLKASILNSA